MSFSRIALFVLTIATSLAAATLGDDKKVYSGPSCIAAPDGFFVNEVWAKVGATCLECHKAGGDAEDSEFVLLDPRKSQKSADDVMRHNRSQFAVMAKEKKGDQSRLLLKAIGKAGH